MAHHKDCHTGRLQRAQDLSEDLLELCIQALCRLVKQKNIRIQKQDFRQRRALLFAAREIVGMAVKQLRQLAEGHNLRQSVRFPLCFREYFQQILADSRFHKQRLRILR